MSTRHLALLGVVAFGLATAFSSRADIQFAGVNLSGAEFGQTVLPGTFGSNYTYPTNGEVDYYMSKGMNFIRLPFRWERLQHTNNIALNSTELGRLNAFVSYATSKGMYVLLDPHNFERYYPLPSNYESSTQGLVGSSVPDSSFTNFWSQVATIFQTNPYVFFGLNNEPNTMPETQLVTSENAAIAAIRATGATNAIFVPGNRWTGAWTWLNSDSEGQANSQAMLGIVDPGSNCVFEVHQYLDSDGSGTHNTIVSATIGMERLTNFTAWLKINNLKGFLGEFAVPGAVIGGSGLGGPALTNMLGYIQTNSDVWLGWSYWGGGPWWGSNPTFPIEPTNIGKPTQTDRPVMDIIKQFFPLPIPTLQFVNGNQFQFTAPQGFVYQPQTSPDLSIGSWTSYGSSFAGTGTTNVVIPVTDPSGFYRVQVSHAP
jgi:endoglucanase